MNSNDFLHCCADGNEKEVSAILGHSDWSDLLWAPTTVDDGFGAPTQSLLEQGIETSLTHENTCWKFLVLHLSQKPEQLRSFVFSQLLYWDIGVFLTPVDYHSRSGRISEMLHVAFNLLDCSSIHKLRQSVACYCMGWGKTMFENMETQMQRSRLLNELATGVEDEQRKI